jgi:hopanoid biosynthesis associated protein HpnK
MSLELIVNADDFGQSSEINRAVIRAHQGGVLSSASLMVGAAAADEAMELARQNPALAVGLHLVVVDGPSVLKPAEIPRLVNSDGRFPNQPVRLGLRYAFNPLARRELGAEIAAQFERFVSTGLPLSHVDGHQHLHLHPAVFDLMLPLAKKFGAKRIRIVRDDLRLALRYDSRRRLAKVISAAIFAGLARRCRGCPIAGPRRTYGFFQSGRMTESYVLLAVQQMQESTEMYFHPTDGPRIDELGPNPGDLDTLLSAAVRKAIEARGLLPGGAATAEATSAQDASSRIPGCHRMPAAAQ